MHRNELFAAIKAGDIAPVYLFQGPEGFVKERAIEALRAKLLPDGFEALNEVILHQPSARAIIDAAETLPVFAEKRLVIAWDFPPLAQSRSAKEQEEAKALAEWLKNAPESCCCVLAIHASADGRKKTVKEIMQNLVTVEFSDLDDREMEKWIAARAKQLKCEMAQGASAKLAFYAGPSLNRVGSELEKLSAYAAQTGRITPQDVEALVTPTIESSLFKLIDLFLDGRIMEGERLLTDLLSTGESPMGILFRLTRQIRTLLRVKQLADMRPVDIEKKLKMNSYALRRALAQSKRFSENALRDGYLLLIDADEQIKSGIMRDIDALNTAIFKLF